MGGFDPTKYGAIPVEQAAPAEFDPTKYGAIPVKVSTPKPLPKQSIAAPLIPPASKAYQQGLQSASQQGALGSAIAKVGGQILPAYHAAVEQTFGTPTISEAISNIPQGLSYIAQHPVDSARMLAGAYAKSVTQPMENAGNDGAPPEVGLLEGIGNIFGVGSSTRQAAEAAGTGQYGKAIGTMVPTLVQLAMGAKVPEDVLKGYKPVYPETGEMLGGLKTAAGDTITPTVGTVASHGGAPAFQRIASQLSGAQSLRETGQLGITDAARAYTRAIIRVGEEADAKGLDAALAKYPERDIGMRTQAVGDAVKQHAGTLYDSIDQAYAANPKVFEPVADSLSKWASDTLKSSEFDRLLSGSPELGAQLRKSLAKLESASEIGGEKPSSPVSAMRGGKSIPVDLQALMDKFPEIRQQMGQPASEPIDLMANYRNARSDLKDIQMNSASSADRRIAGQAVDQLDKVIADGFSKTGNASLNEIYQEANRRWRQGNALMDLGKALEPAYRNIEPDMQIGTQTRPTILSAKKIEDALTELSKVPVRSDKSPFSTAVPNPVDQKTIHQIASFLVKNDAAGGSSIAAQFGVLRNMEASTEIVTNPTRPMAATAYALRLPGMAKALAWAMSSPRAGALFLEISRAAPGTAHAAALAARMNASVQQWEGQ